MAAKSKVKTKTKTKAAVKTKVATKTKSAVKSKPAKSASTKSLKQTVTFKASPHDVYEALMDSRKHTNFTGAPAKISRKVGGKISAYSNYIQGTNLELVADKKIKQAWRGADWKDGEVSTVTYELAPVASGTRLTLTHKDIPAKEFQGCKDGWERYYWIPMKVLLED